MLLDDKEHKRALKLGGASETKLVAWLRATAVWLLTTFTITIPKEKRSGKKGKQKHSLSLSAFSRTVPKKQKHHDRKHLFFALPTIAEALEVQRQENIRKVSLKTDFRSF